jgi:hypothetical protein
MKLMLVILSAFVLSLGIETASSAQEVPVAGGYRAVSVADPEIVSAARFAVREESRREGRPISLLAIKRAETQVVAGLNYRLRLSVRVKGVIQEVSAVVYQSLKNTRSLSGWEKSGGGDGTAPASREVKVYLVALDDGGKTGRKIGCGDSLVPLTRTIKADGEPLKATIEELLSVPHQYNERLGNYWWGENLKVSGVSLRGGVATIRITGRLFVAGICDEPRIEEQIKETARQFAGVRRVRVLVNGRALSEAIR